MKIDVECRECRNVTGVEVAEADYKAWKSGTFIQNAMPYLTPDERELLISKTCGVCWDKLFDLETSALISE